MSSDALDMTRLVRAAVSGEREAVHALVLAIQDDVYGLAIRMLWRPEDAEDATQEILVKVVTHLSSYRSESAFTTWVFRIAKNHLLNVKKSRAEQLDMSFEAVSEHIASALADPGMLRASSAEEPLLAEEVKLGCTQGMLLCLDREHRFAYLLGEVLGVSSEAAALILEVTEPAYRKRLSRSRAKMRAFMTETCGLTAETAACRCDRRLPSAIRDGLVRPERLRFASHPVRPAGRASLLSSMRGEIDEMCRVASVFRSAPDYAAPPAVAARVRAIFDATPTPTTNQSSS